MENEPLRISIREYGSRAHQVGNGPGRGDSSGGGGHMHSWEELREPHGECVVHVREGKPVTALGRRLLGWPPSDDRARQVDSARPGGVL